MGLRDAEVKLRRLKSAGGSIETLFISRENAIEL